MKRAPRSLWALLAWAACLQTAPAAAAAPAATTTKSTKTTQGEAAATLRGRIAFMRCAACHALGAGEPHKVGPNLRSAFGVTGENGTTGAKAAQAKGYHYTQALRQSGLRWDDASLKQWIRDPAALVPGTSMAYVNTLSEPEIEALLAYLKSETRHP